MQSVHMIQIMNIHHLSQAIVPGKEWVDLSLIVAKSISLQKQNHGFKGEKKAKN